MTKRLIQAFTAMLVLATVRAHAACIPEDVHYDAKAQAVDITLTLPAGVEALTLQDMAPFRRTKLWTSPDGSARIGETTLAAARPGQRTLHLRMDVQTDLPREDRAYAPYLRFTDGTVALYTPLFLAGEHAAVALCPRWVPAADQQVIGYGRAQSTPLATDMTRPEGYVAFGRPQVLRHGAFMLVSDRGTPSWIRERIAAQVPALVDLYTATMGPAPVPMLFVFSRPTPRGARDYNGDHLPASITLGLHGDAWRHADPGTLDELTHFLAHELFHSWNSTAPLGSPEGEALLAKEGGADLAKIFASAKVLGQPPQSVWDAVSRSYDACLLELPHGTSVAAALANPRPGPMPYDCGAALMSALALAADPHDPARGYFALWHKLRLAHARHPSDGYRWQELMPSSLAPSVRDALRQAIDQPDAFETKLPEAWAALGLHVRPETTLEPETRRAYMGKVMAHLMAEDCGGMVSFWNNPDGIRLDRPLSRCHALQPGALVTSILGEPLAQSDPVALARRVRAVCIGAGEVPVGYAAEDGRPAPRASLVRCTGPLPIPPGPVRLIAP